MFDKFGEMDSAAEINETAEGLKNEGDKGNLYELAKENGIDRDVAEAFLEGDIPQLCDDMSAAIGKLDIEKKAIDCAEIMEDWVEYIKVQCFENQEIARAVRSKGKSLAGCIAELLKWGFAHQHTVSADIMKAAKVTAGRCTLGIPGMATAKRIITDYYRM